MLKGEGLRYALTGHTARFTVTTRDHYKQEVMLCLGIVSVLFVYHSNFLLVQMFFSFQLRSGGLPLHAVVHGPQETTARIIDNGDGTYVVEYQVSIFQSKLLLVAFD